MIKEVTIYNEKLYIQFKDDKEINSISSLTIKGYPGLTFWINSKPYPITIYNPDGSWTWEINNVIKLTDIKFDPSSIDKTYTKGIVISIISE